MQKAKVREYVIDAIRIFFKNRAFTEVETPLFVPSPDPEPTIELFSSQWLTPAGNATGRLNGSPEFMMKKLLSAGIGNCFQVCKSFRSAEPPSTRHNPEFTILEWYRVDADYTDIMKDCEDLLCFMAQYVSLRTNHPEQSAYDLSHLTEQPTAITFREKTFDLREPWEKLSVPEAFEKYAGISENELLDQALLLKKVKEKGYTVNDNTSFDDLFYQVVLNEIEPHLGETIPSIFYDYPASQAALSKKKQSDPRLAERFEFYIAGLELGNAFSELADWEEQQSRLLAQLEVRAQSKQDTWPIDADFIAALKSGFPRCGGIAVGVDRLVMLFTDAISIEEVLYFPASRLFTLE